MRPALGGDRSPDTERLSDALSPAATVSVMTETSRPRSSVRAGLTEAPEHDGPLSGAGGHRTTRVGTIRDAFGGPLRPGPVTGGRRSRLPVR
ncbi:hypothetical protein GCM10010275_36370 [Streptomyces litmocidini]|nr:hypothetical protein GCM10010275_36370 [Streptomyces litmocidini]